MASPVFLLKDEDIFLEYYKVFSLVLALSDLSELSMD
jgi:hypothetical protein